MSKDKDLPVNTWTASGAFIFRTQLDPRSSKSRVNEFCMRIYPGPNLATEEQAEALAKKLETLLRLEDYSDKLDHNQAPGRDYTIYDGGSGLYWSPNGYGKGRAEHWFENPVYKYADPFDALCEVLRMVRYKVIESFEDVRIIPQDSDQFKNPINVEGKPFVILKSLKEGDVFFSSSKQDDNPTLMDTGVVAYVVCEYVDTVEEAQAKIPKYYGL